jgi:hypothetical protein
MLNATLVQIIRNEEDGSHWMNFEFNTIGGGQGSVLVERSLAAHPRRIVERMLHEGADIRSADLAKKEVQKAIVGASITESVKGTATVGWHGKTFVRPHCSIGPEKYIFLKHSTSLSPLGTLSAWRQGLEGPCKRSRYLVFALSLGFAGPLIRLLDDMDTAVFHLTGKSGTGKTTLERAASSIAGSSSRDALLTHDKTLRGQEEQAQKHNDGLLVITEIARQADTRLKLRRYLEILAHSLTGRRGRERSEVVFKTLPNMTYRVVVLSSGEQSLDLQTGHERQKGEQRRLVEIAVPRPEKGGVFDRLHPGEWSSDWIQEVEATITANQGVALDPFLQKLVEDYDENAQRVRGLVTQFLGRVRAGRTGWETDFARKFGWIYAAAMLAAEFGIAPWNTGETFEAVSGLYRRARELCLDAESAADDVVRQLARLCMDSRLFPRVNKGEQLARSSHEFLGIRRQLSDGTEAIALLSPKWAELVRPQRLGPQVRRELAKRGVLLQGKESGRHVSQLLVQGLGRRDFLLFDRNKLAQRPRTPTATAARATEKTRASRDRSPDDRGERYREDRAPRAIYVSFPRRRGTAWDRRKDDYERG